MQITPVNETLWYRRFWLIVGVVFLLGFMAANYWSTKLAILSAYRQIQIMQAVPATRTSGAPVVGLFLTRRPSAILGTVGAIVVRPVHAESGRTWTHIFKERLEAIPPSVAHGNATTSVVAEQFAVPVIAAVPHSDPDRVNRGPCHSVSCAAFDQSLRGEASATRSFTCGQVRVSDDDGVTTRAFAQPDCSFIPRFDPVDSNQTTEYSTRDIYDSHATDYTKWAIVSAYRAIRIMEADR